MPTLSRTSQSKLRRAQSVPSNILRGAQIDENLRLKSEVARQHALVAASRAFRRANPERENAAGIQQSQEEARALAIMHNVVESETNNGRTNEVLCTKPRRVRPDASQLHDGNETPFNEAVHSSIQVSTYKSPGFADVTPRKTSFQRLGQQKSMFSLRKAASPDRFSVLTSGSRRTPTLRGSAKSSPRRMPYPTGLSPGRPMPTAEEILRQLPNPHQTSYSQDQAIRLARDEYIRQIEVQNMRTLESEVDNSARPKLVRHLQRTLRRTSNAKGTRAEDQNTAQGLHQASGKSRVRKVSRSLKASFQRLFRGSSTRPLPTQHIDAQRQHYDRINDQDTINPIRNPVIPVPPPEIVARMNARPSSDTFASEEIERQMYTPRLCRMKSTESVQTGSRVTSWANSAATRETCTQTKSDGESTEKIRLSVIQENDPHQPTVSNSTGASARPRYAAFENPLRRIHSRQQINTDEIFAALQQQIERSSGSTADGSTPMAIADKSPYENDSQVQRSDRNGSYASTHPTIRVVRDGSEDFEPALVNLYPSKQVSTTFSSRHANDVFEPCSPWGPGDQQPLARLPHKLSLQQIADLNEAHEFSRNQTIRETRSTLFPSRGQYPVHKAAPLDEPMRATVSTDSRPKTDVRAQDNTAANQTSSEDSEESGSVYSRHTNGTPFTKPCESQNDNEKYGTAFIVDTQPITDRYANLVSRARGFDKVTPDQSHDSWKTWMASEVSRLEGPNSEAEIDLPSLGKSRKRGFGHVRESAERNMSGSSQPSSRRIVSGPKQALEMVRKISGLRIAKRAPAVDGTDGSEEMSASSAKRHLQVLPATVQSTSDENKPPAPDTNGPKNYDPQSLPCKHSEQETRLSTVPESPMTPFTKFMASDESPLAGYELREQSPSQANLRNRAERENRRRRMQSSLPAGGKFRTHGPSQYPWLQRYRESQFVEDVSPVNPNRRRPKPAQIPDGMSLAFGWRGSTDGERSLGLLNGGERGFSETPAFI